MGVIPFIKKEFHLFLCDYASKFGSIFSFKMGQETLVVLSSYEAIEKAFRSDDFVSRPKSELTNLLRGYGKKRDCRESKTQTKKRESIKL